MAVVALPDLATLSRVGPALGGSGHRSDSGRARGALRVRSLLQEWEPAAIRLPAWGEVGGGGAVLLPAGHGGALGGQ